MSIASLEEEEEGQVGEEGVEVQALEAEVVLGQVLAVEVLVQEEVEQEQAQVLELELELGLGLGLAME